LNKLLNWRFWLGLNSKEVSIEPFKSYEITVLVPAYNEEDSIQETIDSIKAQTIPIKEIIVIDDFSKDRTGEIARANNVKVIRTDINQGTKAKAQDYVLSKNLVTTELVVTIDGDTLLHKDAIKNTLKYFNDPKTASVCGMVIPAKIKTLFERGRFIEYLFGIGLAKAAQNHVGAVLVSSGCFSIFRTELIFKMGGFKARTMAEDMDLTWEFAFEGYHIYCAQDALCYPYEPYNFKIFVNQIDRWYRSYFQNISVHKNDFKKNYKITFFVFAYLLEGLLSPITKFLGLYLLFQNGFQAIAGLFILDMAIVSVVSLIKAFRLKCFWKAFFSIPCYIVISYINFVVFWQSLFREWILRTPLKTWNKGH
jgi:biofilm PGA synthesis N-glycosyltransferase PgaC